MTAAAAAITVVLAAADAVMGPDDVAILAVVIGPLVAVLRAGERQVAGLGVLAIALVAASGAWNDYDGELSHLYRLVVVAVGCMVAALAARFRERERAALQRLTHVSGELSVVEGQLAAALAGLAEAVTVQDAEGRVVFANQAAADLLGYRDPDGVVSTPTRDIVARFETVHEDGRPLAVEELPGRRVLAGEDPEPLLVRVRNLESGEERWRVVKASPVRGSDGRVLFAVNVVEDVTEVKRAEIAQRLLAESSRVLSGSLDPHETLERIPGAVVPALADWCLVHVPGDDGAIDLVGVGHVDPAKVEFARATWIENPATMDATSALAVVLQGGDAVLAPRVTDEMLVAAARSQEHLRNLRAAGIRSTMVVPMRTGGRTVGAITMVSAESGRVYTDSDLELATEIARRAAVVAENARLYAEQAEVARVLQEGLLPDRLPDMPGWTTAAMYRPAGEGADVGGDFYDALPVGDGWLLVIGDVAGRGAAAATLTAMARHTLRTAAMVGGDVREGVRLLNRALLDRRTMALCSVCALHVHGGERTGDVDVLCAGHPEPFIVRGAEIHRVGDSGPLLGAIDEAQWPLESVTLGPGDQIVLFTDGVIDARGTDGRFGEERLQATLEGTADARATVARVRDTLNAFEAPGRRDDTAMVVLQRLAGAPAENGARPHGRHRTRLPNSPEAAGVARRAVSGWLEGALTGGRMDDLRLLVSEVVTNGVRHATRRGGDAIDLEVCLYEDRVRVEVRDPGPGFVVGRLVEPPPDAVGGRGLLIVDRVSLRWGIADGDQTCVWFEVARG